MAVAMLAMVLQGQEAESRLSVSARFTLNERIAELGLGAVTPRSMVVEGDALTLLAFPKSAWQNGVLVRTDLAGRAVLWAARLGSDEVSDYAVDKNGRTYVLSGPIPGPIRLRCYDPYGREMDIPGPVPSVAAKLVAVDDKLLSVGANGAIQSLREASPLATVNIDPELMRNLGVLSLPGGRIAIVDEVEAAIQLIDTTTGGVSSVSIDHPEALRVKAQYRASTALMPHIHGVTVQAAAAGPDGSVYCLLSGFRPQQGAPVIVLDSAGKLSRTLRCPMPNGPSAGVPLSIGVSGGRLFMLDSAGTVTTFTL
ncbi:MAG TPA: hypothetical protein VMR62_15605 [Bryobacteraceae bacterium]|nr:hypothetical protein [Bryobacteraceae bacterium]